MYPSPTRSQQYICPKKQMNPRLACLGNSHIIEAAVNKNAAFQLLLADSLCRPQIICWLNKIGNHSTSIHCHRLALRRGNQQEHKGSASSQNLKVPQQIKRHPMAHTPNCRSEHMPLWSCVSYLLWGVRLSKARPIWISAQDSRCKRESTHTVGMLLTQPTLHT